MKRHAFLWLAQILLCSSSMLAQVDVQVKKSVSGLTNPVVVGERILVDEDSKPVVADVGLVTVDQSWKFSLIKAKRDGKRVDLVDVGDGKLLAVGAGAWEIDCTLFDPEKGIWNNEFNITLGEVTPPPTPPTPPDDDEVDPPTPPEPASSLTELARQHPKDAANQALMRKAYQDGAAFLYGVGSSGISNIENVMAGVNRTFNGKTCPSSSICAEWAVWKQKIDAELIRQQREKQFSRQDWWQALNDISEGLK